MQKTVTLAAALVGATILAGSALAQDVTLRIHHILPPVAPAHAKFMVPWSEKVTRESGGRLKFQIFPAMQLGGTPAQLVDQVKDGVVDIVWTLPGYTPGRFPLVEAFELPFIASRDAEATSKALWDYVQAHAKDEFKDYHPLGFHVHGPGVFHVVKRPITSVDDFKGLKFRAPTRLTNRMLGAFGATPVGMPVPQVPEALSKGTIDGAVVPYEVGPSLKLQELVKFHSETDPGEPAVYVATFIYAMNRAKYQSLPADLKKVLDDNSGLSLSAFIGKVFRESDEPGKALAVAQKNPINVIAKAEVQKMRQAAQPVIDGWVEEMKAKNVDGRALIKSAQDLIAKHGGK
ncbi:MAG: TRAP transporter substrate-binding protein [Alphaproteobacteria bacterium]|nr:TRAP transporter substrate-binding protein [Alphaproteobacteria bacterium]